MIDHVERSRAVVLSEIDLSRTRPLLELLGKDKVRGVTQPNFVNPF